MRYGIFFFSLMVLSLQAIAQSPCPRNRATCWRSAPWTANGMVHAVSDPGDHFRENPGIYFARGTGRTCDEAFRNAQINMMDAFDYLTCSNAGRITCGVNGGPFVINRDQCNRGSRGVHTAWAQCDNIFHGEYISPQQPNTGASGLILIEMARRNEVRARASRNR